MPSRSVEEKINRDVKIKRKGDVPMAGQFAGAVA
jgi:hypothetical protein